MTFNVKCPAILSPQNNPNVTTVFLGGGISGCGDWQRVAEDILTGDNNIILAVNPRRDEFDITDPTMTEQQINWEHDHLKMVDLIMFWFPSDTLCPITLFELGYQLGRRQVPLVIGTDAKYQRRTDVIIQTRLVRPAQVIYDNLLDTLNAVRRYAFYMKGTPHEQ